MTDQQALFAVLVRLGITPKVAAVHDAYAGPTIEITLEAQYGHVFGNKGLECSFLFDDKGNHVRTGIWKNAANG